MTWSLYPPYLNISQCFWCVSNHCTASNTDKKHKVKPWLTAVKSLHLTSALHWGYWRPVTGRCEAAFPSLNQGLKNHLEDLMESQPQSPRVPVCDPSTVGRHSSHRRQPSEKHGYPGNTVRLVMILRTFFFFFGNSFYKWGAINIQIMN